VYDAQLPIRPNPPQSGPPLFDPFTLPRSLGRCYLILAILVRTLADAVVVS
jgi:hypothetical protein